MLLATAFLMRLWLVFRYRFDSDEPQHMHVAWGWANGFVQYGDIFDNHMPLFHLLTAPLFFGGVDDPRLLFAARLLMLPLFLMAIVLVWLIARRLFDATTAAWSAVLAALFPTFFLGSLEYRTDDLWLVFWLAAIAALVSDMKWRSAIAGLMIGCAFAVSMKTTVMVIVSSSSSVVRPSFFSYSSSSGHDSPTKTSFLSIRWSLCSPLRSWCDNIVSRRSLVRSHASSRHWRSPYRGATRHTSKSN